MARFKAGLMAAELFTDLTAGAGVDAYFMAKEAKQLAEDENRRVKAARRAAMMWSSPVRSTASNHRS